MNGLHLGPHCLFCVMASIFRVNLNYFLMITYNLVKVFSSIRIKMIENQNSEFNYFYSIVESIPFK